MNKIREIVKMLIKKYKTRSPFEICDRLKIHIVFSGDLPSGVNGVYLNLSDCGKIILINSSLKKCKLEKICAHELGHAILHTNLNSFNYDHSLSSEEGKFEKEADLFAFFLLDEIDISV
ncbi:MAG: ImmA/IrrE family metallo-endopeptidase [Clostridia bacterium]|nr:ImmA/IrrE family metallo-endopeptidase [Clostridia bacterium]